MNRPLIAASVCNTTVRLGVTSLPLTGPAPQWTAQICLETEDFDPAVLAPQIPSSCCSWRVASVHRPAERRLAAWVQSTRPEDDYHRLSHRDLPLAVQVDYPDRVGMDRLVAAVAVNERRQPDRPAIIVDAGTAITVDLVGVDGAFLGGVILPGFRLVARALAAYTDLLPQAGSTFANGPPAVVGKSTQAAIRSGLFWGSVGAVRELVARITGEIHASPQIFITGGDAEKLAACLSEQARFVPDLVLTGIALASGR